METNIGNVAKRSGQLSEKFRLSATETTESVLESYVDFIFLALERLRKEIGEIKVTDAARLKIPDGAISIANATPNTDCAAS